MELKDLKIEQIQDYIQQEKAKGRSVKDIVKELVAVRSDVTILSHDPEIGRQQIFETLSKLSPPDQNR
ncbi:hypothetical protein [Chlorogloea sp. CCALA 695]|uniref:hypothetical protein n=1 Tax=Chlorogloea sp. CCALA 695 TaxID=2107693 RepID=UPI000D065956|nr:hypothetical protein [Chlorogloea sp. CCALA 695]PSB27277.1 hypothetical protein C7B70_23035 [Chlorogloea sp. CCALA 695]